MDLVRAPFRIALGMARLQNIVTAILSSAHFIDKSFILVKNISAHTLTT